MTLTIGRAVATARAPALPAPCFLAMRRGASLAVAFALLATAVGSDVATAAPGDLDPTFGGTGSIVELKGIGASGLVLQPDGKPVVIGEGVVAGSSPPVRPVCAGPIRNRRLAGLHLRRVGNRRQRTHSCARACPTRRRANHRRGNHDPRRRAGRLCHQQSSSGMSTARWTRPLERMGSRLATGSWPPDFLPGPAVSAVVVEPNGKITVAGSAAHLGLRHLLLAQFDPEGTVDASFGTAGVVEPAGRRHRSCPRRRARRRPGGSPAAGRCNPGGGVLRDVVALRRRRLGRP